VEASAVTEISDEVVAAAQLADAEWNRTRKRDGRSWGSVPPDQVRRLIAAAVVAERERIASRPFVLVWRDERGTEICRSTPVMPGTAKIGIPLDAQSADLITEDVTL
jgi:hypothetical protein